MNKGEEAKGLFGQFLIDVGSLFVERVDEENEASDIGSNDLLEVLEVDSLSDAYDAVVDLQERLEMKTNLAEGYHKKITELKAQLKTLQESRDQDVERETLRLKGSNKQLSERAYMARQEASNAKLEAEKAKFELSSYKDAWQKFQDKATEDARRLQLQVDELQASRN